MLFNSFTFALFLPIVYALYWSLQRRSLRAQNLLLLAANYVFYGWWDCRFLVLLLLNCVADFYSGIWMERARTPVGRKAVLGVSLVANLGVLGFFKYYNFFVESMTALLVSIGLPANPPTLELILPVGISFYTFQSLSYTIDVYRGRIRATRDLLGFLVFHSFFPQLVAGPIERAGDLLPQVLTRRHFDVELAKSGMRQMLWGFYKKVVVADNIGAPVDAVFQNYASADSATLLVAAMLSLVQVYCDFSGYSDIALGTARLFGFELTRNFAYPLFSRDIAEFWRRWHISLYTWFGDYVFRPLGGLSRNFLVACRNVFFTFTLIGLWHGASWNFVAFGVVNAVLYVAMLAWRRVRRRSPRTRAVAEGGGLFPGPRDALLVGFNFVQMTLAFVVVRTATVGDAFGYCGSILVGSWSPAAALAAFAMPLTLSITCLAVEWVHRARPHGLEVSYLPMGARWLVYYGVIALAFWYGKTVSRPFIYFAF